MHGRCRQSFVWALGFRVLGSVLLLTGAGALLMHGDTSTERKRCACLMLPCMMHMRAAQPGGHGFSDAPLLWHMHLEQTGRHKHRQHILVCLRRAGSLRQAGGRGGAGSGPHAAAPAEKSFLLTNFVILFFFVLFFCKF